MKGNVLFVFAVSVVLAVSALLAADPDNENTDQQSRRMEGSWSVTSVVRNSNELPAELQPASCRRNK